MLKGKKTARRGDTLKDWGGRRAGRVTSRQGESPITRRAQSEAGLGGTPGSFASLRLLALTLSLALTCAAPAIAVSASFSSSSARSGTEGYVEGNSFGTNREAEPAFYTDPETGDRHFQTPEMPKGEEPDQIEIMPIYPEVNPKVPRPKPPVVVKPGN